MIFHRFLERSLNEFWHSGFNIFCQNSLKTRNRQSNKNPNHNPTNPQTTFQTRPGGMRALSFESAAPVLDGVQCVLNTSCSSCQTSSSKFLELFAQFQVLQALGSSSNPPKVPLAALLIPPGLPEILLKFALGHPSVELLRLLAHFLPSPKLIKI